MNNDKVREWIKFACDSLGWPDLAGTIWFEWNSRFTRRMGDASASMMRIRLSIPLWPRATEAEQRNTVIHEVCHLLNPIINGTGLPSHGKAWGRLMRRCGLSPTRCHKVDRTGLARKMPRVAVAKCRCMNHELTSRVYHKILRGVKYKCRKCRAVLALDIVTTAQTCSN